MLKINEQITFLRKQRGLTQEELARILGVSNQAVSKWESAQSCPDISLLPEIAQYFEVSIDELLGYKNINTSQNIILQLHTLLDSLPSGEDFQLALKLAYVTHASLFAKDMATSNLGFDTTESVKHAANAEWGLSCISLPQITTYMRMGSVFFSNNQSLNLNNSCMKAMCKLFEVFSDLKNLKTIITIYELTIHSEAAYASIQQIAQESGFPENTIISCIEGQLDKYLTEKYEIDETLYRIEGMYLHLVPLLAMFSNIN